ncbi:DeoR/GlpR family DNA-binding transcription regulator [Dethiosulfatarculus sandiegensis]|uniref:DeoR-like transcriptional repressor C-terminal sensor domain-containing protein n=1 Tax=Dethiosulfatarculus sandiegensis TaxID=1429043 RepID=A0A0D2JSK4_9BACT|nr:DeoR/GlpR family DNA-binding transcription regulator [Dethiosulfatarculus sandiegensis]KIX12465.1 hypothetical protein X474_19225 [Dethiosulfatarculus sandiegensis]
MKSGIKIRTQTGHPDYYKTKLSHKPFSKYAIALRAAAELSEGESFLIDAGSSLTPIAKIVKSIGSSNANFTHYTIMTHNNAAFQALQDVNTDARFNVFYTGGRYDRDLNASFGHQAELAYKDFNPHWVFIGQNGMEAHQGLFCHGNTEELSLKKNIFAMPTLKRVIISDFVKIGQLSGLVFGESSELTSNVTGCYVFTDDIHDDKFKSYIKKKGIEKQRFDEQCRILVETYFVKIVKVNYEVEIISNDLINLSQLGIDVIDIHGKFFLKEPTTAIENIIDKIKRISGNLEENKLGNEITQYENIKYRIHLKSSDLTADSNTCNSATVDTDSGNVNTDYGYVDICFKFKFDDSIKNDNSITLKSVDTEVDGVNLNWGNNGTPYLKTIEKE